MESSGRGGLTRKEMLKLSALGGAALVLPIQRVAQTQLSISNRIPESRLPRPFQVPLRVPPVLRPYRRNSKLNIDYYTLTMKASRVQILPDGPKTYIFGYNGITPGPTILEQRGRRCVVRQINRLPQRHPYLGYECTTSVHLHGSDSAPQFDGWANDTTRPGFYKDYRYPDDQAARALWYHDHAVHHTAQNSYMGCAANY
ncbi:MAG: multicopper oxidase domain-containing protein, partial [Rubrobacter sp.]